jgi:hypothetical protein
MQIYICVAHSCLCLKTMWQKLVNQSEVRLCHRHTQYVTLVCVCLSVCLQNVRKYPQSVVTFCGYLLKTVLCVNWNFSGKEKQGRTTRHFKITTAVNISIMMLRFVTLCILTHWYKRFGGIFSLHLQNIVMNLAVVSPSHPLSVRPTHNVCTAVINLPTTNKPTQPCLKYVTFSITRSCRSKLFHGQSLQVTGSDQVYYIYSAVPSFCL